jgi:DNA modification methylase
MRVNKLNDLEAKKWLQFTKTWFVHNPPRRKKNEVLHPAKYPEGMVEEFIRFFTKEGEVVFDPFLGTGSTLVACHNSQRNGIGIELQEKYADIARKRIEDLQSQLTLTEDGARDLSKQLVIKGDSSKVGKLWDDLKLPEISCVVTSPPYGMMLQKKGLASAKREEEGLDTQYSEDDLDLGNAKTYDEFLDRLVDIFVEIKPKVKVGGHLVVILQNYMNKGEYITLPWDFAGRLRKHFQFRGERIWCQDNKTLYPYGYRYSFVPNVHHHYCLIFKKLEEDKEKIK